MKIAIHAADLDSTRIDGTRIYIKNCLDFFGKLAPLDEFQIYHKNKFNPQLVFKNFSNYREMKADFPFFWTQTRFALEIMKKSPDALWMPIHSLPFLRRSGLKTTITIHDLAFKIFPDHYPSQDLRRLNFFTRYALTRADKIIAVSCATKEDIRRFYPDVDPAKIKVIYHGYNKELFHEKITQEQIRTAKEKYKINFSSYFIYVGAIQPRKNLDFLIEAFSRLQNDRFFGDFGLVIAGEPAWLSDATVEKANAQKNIRITGRFKTENLPGLLAGAIAFINPSLYEGFGIPVIEAMACGVPVLAANNSSLREIVEDWGILFDTNSVRSIENALRKIISSDKMKSDLKKKSLARAQGFSWEQCARETLSWIKT